MPEVMRSNEWATRAERQTAHYIIGRVMVDEVYEILMATDEY